MAHDRNPKFIVFADKLASRFYIQSKIGNGYLPRIFFVGSNLDEESFDKLPTNIAIKVNHASGGVLLRHSEAPLSRGRFKPKENFPRIMLNSREINYSLARSLTDSWLSRRYENEVGSGYEWAYSQINPQLFAEEFINSESISFATDFKFFVFREKCPYFLVIEKTKDQVHKRMYDEHGTRLKAFPREHFIGEERIQISPVLQNMMKLAVTLADGIDHLRVDFFVDNDRVYVGELTPYDAGGVRVCTRNFERYAGSFWHPDWKGVKRNST